MIMLREAASLARAVESVRNASEEYKFNILQIHRCRLCDSEVIGDGPIVHRPSCMVDELGKRLADAGNQVSN